MLISNLNYRSNYLSCLDINLIIVDFSDVHESELFVSFYLSLNKFSQSLSSCGWGEGLAEIDIHIIRTQSVVCTHNVPLAWILDPGEVFWFHVLSIFPVIARIGSIQYMASWVWSLVLPDGSSCQCNCSDITIVEGKDKLCRQWVIDSKVIHSLEEVISSLDSQELLA